MPRTATDADDTGDDGGRWSLLGVAGGLSLCCLFAAPLTATAVGTTVAGGTTAALGGGLVRILVSAVTVGVLGVAARWWTDSPSCER